MSRFDEIAARAEAATSFGDRVGPVPSALADVPALVALVRTLGEALGGAAMGIIPNRSRTEAALAAYREWSR